MMMVAEWHDLPVRTLTETILKQDVSGLPSSNWSERSESFSSMFLS